MTLKQIKKIFRDTAFVRTGGSQEEKKTAEYIRDVLDGFGLTAQLVPFEVNMATIRLAKLVVDGKEIACKGYLCCGSGEGEADIYNLTEDD